MSNYLHIDGKKIELSEETVERLKEELMVSNEGVWIPEEGEYYKFLHDCGAINDTNKQSSIDHIRFSVGNYYPVELKVPNLLDELRIHIQEMRVKYGDIKRGDDFFKLSDSNIFFRQICFCDKKEYIEYFNGTIMQIQATDEEQEKRRLILRELSDELKKLYEYKG